MHCENFNEISMSFPFKLLPPYRKGGGGSGGGGSERETSLLFSPLKSNH
jgi:hypothetical protein